MNLISLIAHVLEPEVDVVVNELISVFVTTAILGIDEMSTSTAVLLQPLELCHLNTSAADTEPVLIAVAFNPLVC